MPRITPIHWKILDCILRKLGFTFTRQKGTSHMVYTKKGLLRPLVVPCHSKDLSIGVITSNLRTAGIDRDTYFKYLAMC